METIRTSASFCANTQSVRYQQNWKTACAIFTVVTSDTVAALPGAACTVSMGIGSVSLQLTGFIDSIEIDTRTGLTTVTGRDVLRRATDYLLIPLASGQAEFITVEDDAINNAKLLFAICGLVS